MLPGWDKTKNEEVSGRVGFQGRDFVWLVLMAGMAGICFGLRTDLIRTEKELTRYQEEYRDPEAAKARIKAAQEETRKILDDAIKIKKQLIKELEAINDSQEMIQTVNPFLSAKKARALAICLYETAARYGVDWDLVVALASTESRFSPQAVSWAGAVGVMQLMPGTARDLGVDNPFDVRQNIDGGVRYLAWLLRIYEGDRDLSIAAYNAGPGRVRDSIPNIRETQLHVRRVQLASRGLTRERDAR